MDKLVVIKIGGNVIDNDSKLSSFLEAFAGLSGGKILVHGGGKMATRLAHQLNIPHQMVDGRRITDAATLEVVTMVYAGLVNKSIVAKLQAKACNALGISGPDGDSVRAHKRVAGNTDFGFAGDIDSVNTDLLRYLLDNQLCPVISPITHDKHGQLLNTNADTIAQELAKAMGQMFEVTLVYCFEKEGVLKSVDDESSVIQHLDATYYQQLKASGVISSGMIPKIDNAFAAIAGGVKNVIIGKAERLAGLLQGTAGTRIQ